MRQACETRERDYFRSEDPLEAARFVVSDAVAVLWSGMREVHGAVRLTESAAAQLLRWESRYGWTRRGDGWVSARETSLARVLSQLLVVPDLWTEVARHYQMLWTGSPGVAVTSGAAVGVDSNGPRT